MSKFLNVFNTLAEYQAFSASTEYVQPNVALVKETNVLYYDYGNNQPQADQSDFKVESQETSIGGDKYGKGAITKINYIPSGVTSLENAFSGFTSIVNAPEIPNSVTNMKYTFYGCSSLVNVPNISSGVIYMNSAFNRCISLVNVPVMPSSLTSLYYTFYGCSSLVNVPPIPSGVTQMCGAFQACSSLKEITFFHTTPPSYEDTLRYSPIETIYVPDESVDVYKTASGWSEFADKFKPLSSKPTE